MAQDINASELLARFARDRDESAFAELVNRYAGLVHAAALRRADGRHGLAEDAAQLVFLELARHAARLRPDTQLGGWLHRCTLSITSDLMKSERRRAAREDRAGTEQDAGPARAEDTRPTFAPRILTARRPRPRGGHSVGTDRPADRRNPPKPGAAGPRCGHAALF